MSVRPTVIRVHDFETDVLAPKQRSDAVPDMRVVQAGWCDLVEDEEAPGGWRMRPPIVHYVNPGRPISPLASAVHRIVDSDVAGAQPFDRVAPIIAEGVDVLAAHNDRFEQQVGAANNWVPDLRRICTWKVALRLWPEAPGHKLQELRFWLGLRIDRSLADQAHSAGADSYVAARLLKVSLQSISVEDAVAISAEPAIMPYLTFSEHAMKPIAEVPTSFLEWIVNPVGKRDPFSEDVLATAWYHINLRRSAKAS